MLYFRGCTAREKQTDISKATEELLTLAGIDYHVLEDEKCCGSVLLRTGFESEAKEQIEKNTEVLKDEKIIVTDEITSTGLNTENIVYIFAAYNDDGNLVYTKINNKTVFPDSSPVVVMEFVPEKNIEFKSYKIFRWELLF